MTISHPVSTANQQNVQRADASASRPPFLLRFLLWVYLHTGTMRSMTALRLLDHEHRLAGRPRRAAAQPATHAELLIRALSINTGARARAKAELALDRHAGRIDGLRARAATARATASRIVDLPLPGPRGEILTVGETIQRQAATRERVEDEVKEGSQRHLRTKPHNLRVISLVPIVDFPILLWLTSSIANVNWQQPLGMPLVIAALFAFFATVVTALVAHITGEHLRSYKDDERRLIWGSVPLESRGLLLLLLLLIAVLGVLMFTRAYVEATASGESTTIAVLLALMLAIASVLSNMLVAWAIYWDGSGDTADLDYYQRTLSGHLARREQLFTQAAKDDREIETLKRLAARVKSRAEVEASSPLRHADETILLSHTLTQTVGPFAGETADPNKAVGTVGHHVQMPQVHADERSMTTTVGHIETELLPDSKAVEVES